MLVRIPIGGNNGDESDLFDDTWYYVPKPVSDTNSDGQVMVLVMNMATIMILMTMMIWRVCECGTGCSSVPDHCIKWAPAPPAHWQLRPPALENL